MREFGTRLPSGGVSGRHPVGGIGRLRAGARRLAQREPPRPVRKIKEISRTNPQWLATLSHYRWTRRGRTGRGRPAGRRPVSPAHANRIIPAHTAAASRAPASPRAAVRAWRVRLARHLRGRGDRSGPPGLGHGPAPVEPPRRPASAGTRRRRRSGRHRRDGRPPSPSWRPCERARRGREHGERDIAPHQRVFADGGRCWVRTNVGWGGSVRYTSALAASALPRTATERSDLAARSPLTSVSLGCLVASAPVACRSGA
jgi:hypothetical protein